MTLLLVGDIAFTLLYLSYSNLTKRVAADESRDSIE